jgi:signal transduction histidine kinase
MELFRDTLRTMARLARLALVEVRVSPEPEVFLLDASWIREARPDLDIGTAREGIIQAARSACEHNLRESGEWVVCVCRGSRMLVLERGEGSAAIAAWCEAKHFVFERLEREAACLEALGQGVVVLDSEGRVEILSARAGEMLGAEPEAAVGLPASQVLGAVPIGADEDVVRGSLPVSELSLGYQVEPREGRGHVVKLWRHEARAGLQARRRQFLSALRHDVRSPLTSLRGLVGVLGDEPEMSGDDRTRMIALLQAEVERMVTWVEDYLVLLGLRNEPRPVAPVVVKAQTLVQLAEVAFREHAAERGIGFEVGTCPDWVTVRVDPSLRLPFLKNLVGHFFRIGEAGAVVTLQTGGAGEFVVEGRGPGLYTARVEDPFGTISRSTASGKRTPGVGLGLYLVKKVADVHGWRVFCEQVEGALRVSVHWVELAATIQGRV